VSFVPGVGVPISLAMLGGEKLVTSIIKIAKAEIEAATLPNWMLVDLNKKKRKKDEERKETEKRDELIRNDIAEGLDRFGLLANARARSRNDAERRGGY
jgi:3-isopropylmalate dehydratase small subunit